MEAIFKQIENNIFESQEKTNLPTKTNLQGKTSSDPLDILKIVRHIPQSEVKNNFQMFKDIQIPNSQIDEQKKLEDEEYADYGRRNKTGIHFQIISDHNVSIEIVPEDILNAEMESLLQKYKAVFDPSLKLWLLPYVNYLPLYNDLIEIKNFKYKIYKIGSIAKKCHENKALTILEIKRKVKEEKIDYTKDTMERNVDTLPKSIKNALYDFQFEGVKFGIEHHCRFLLADEMGVGKTLQAISLAYIYRESWPVLVVCPGSMKYNWKGEIQTWLGLKDYRINIINSSRQKLSQEAYFYIISYDLMRNVIKKMRQMTFDFVILDEAHSIKNKDSLRAKNILPIAVRAKRLIIMTGTPLLAKPYEGYPLLYALRPDIFCYFKKFAYRYCDPQPTPMGINWSGTSNTKELHWILSCLMVRRLKSDVLNQLPPKRRQKIEIATNEKVIHELKRTRKNVKGRKGTLECYTLTSKAKIEGVLAYISDIIDAKEKFIVFAYHHEMLDALEKLCKEKRIDYMRIDGTTKQETRYQYVNYFQLNKSCQVAILSIIAASTGITLTAAHMVIFAELTWTPSIMIQAEDRVHRIGQKSEFVDIKYLYGKETLDDFILDKLQKKLTIVSTTLDDKQANFGVKAEQNLINFGSKANDFVRYKKGEPDEEFDLCDMDDMEKKMFDDLGETTGKKEKDKDKDRNKSDNKNVNKNNKNKKKKKKNKKNKSGKKRIKINRNYSDSESESKSGEEKDDKDKDKDVRYPKEEEKEENANENEEINLGKKFKEDSTSRKKEQDYPKESQRQQKSKNKDNIKSKRTSSYSKVRSNMGSKISGIKDLKKYWATNNKEKSVNKITKNKNNLKNGNVSKNTVLTLLSDLLSDEKVEQDKNKDSIIQKNKKEEMKDKEQGQQLDLFVEALYNNQGENKNNKDKENEQFEKDLMVNLHNVNMRRTMSQESTKKTQKSLIEQIDNPEKEFQSHNKRILFPSDRNHFKENIDENVVHNLKDKVPLI